MLAGGGTAGHINPAITIANYIKKRKPDAEILFAGTKNGLESKLVKAAGYNITFIKVYGIKRKLDLKNFKAIFYAYFSVYQAKKLLKKEKPDVVIGTGGYVSWPVLRAASKLKIKTAIHEQNAFPGLTTKKLSKFVDKVFISFEYSSKYFDDKNKLILTGNPIREEMLYISREKAREELGIEPEEKVLLSFGGSLGARELNANISDYIALEFKNRKILHYHATGSFGFKWMPKRLIDSGVDVGEYKNIRIFEYITNMPTLMAAVDLVVCRAGAITLGELAVMGKPAIIIPSPNVANNHQYHNAKALFDKQACFMLEESSLSGIKLKQIIDKLIYDEKYLHSLSKNISKTAIFDSTDKIYNELQKMIKK